MLKRVQMLGALMWVAYGLLIGASPVIAANVLVFAAAAWTMGRRGPAPRRGAELQRTRSLRLQARTTRSPLPRLKEQRRELSQVLAPQAPDVGEPGGFRVGESNVL